MRRSVGRADIVSLLARAAAVLLVSALVAHLLVAAIAVDPVDPVEAAADKGVGSFVVSLLRGVSAGALGAAGCVVAALLVILAVRGVRRLLGLVRGGRWARPGRAVRCLRRAEPRASRRRAADPG
ncbi:hypothetical protein [Streptomyces sp. NPDC003023]|uniref:hypothetical protein n=1 Tax=Streptomyces sp. NPDC003023 TaxID=3364675 RepID=UPI0036CE39B4